MNIGKIGFLSCLRLGFFPGWGKGVFLAGLLACMVAILGLSQSVYWERDLPPEPDDAWSYLSRAVRLEQCLWHDCPAYQYLVEVNRLGSDQPTVARNRLLNSDAAVYVGPPLHPLLLVGLHQLNLSWNDAYQWLSGGSALLTVWAGALLLSMLFGHGPAGIALLFLSLHLFPRQGLHYWVPGNFTLGLAFLTWAAVLKKTPVAVVGLIGLMLLTHPVGQLYGCVALALYGLLHGDTARRESLMVLMSGGLVLGLPNLLARIVPQPERFFNSFVFKDIPMGLEGWDGIKWNIYGALELLRGEVAGLDSKGLLVLLVVLGLVLVPEAQRRQVWGMTLLMGGALVGSLYFVFFDAPAELFSRLWVPMGFLLAGLLGLAGWQLTGMAPTRPGVALLAGLALVAVFAEHHKLGVEKFRRTAEFMQLRQNQHWAPQQPALLASLSQPGDQVMYRYQEHMNYFLAHGGMAHGAMLWSSLQNSREELSLVRQNPRLRWMVTPNPILRRAGNNPALQHIFQRGGVVLRQDATLRLAMDSRQAQQVVVRLVNPGVQPVAVQVVLEPQERGHTLSIPARFQGWLPMAEAAQGWRFTLTAPATLLRVEGVRENADQTTQWPWGRGWSLHYGAEKGLSLALDDSQLLPGTGRVTRIIDDRGSLVLAQVQPLSRDEAAPAHQPAE